MKTLHIITGLATGGAERALYNLLHGGLASRFDNHIISLSDEGTLGEPIKQLGGPVTPLGMRGGVPTLSGLVKLRQVMQSFQPDLIQGWMYHGNLAATLAASLSKHSPAVIWNVRHSLYDLGYERFMTRQVIRLNRLLSSRPATILYNSKVSRGQHEAFGFAVEPGQVIPNGIDIERFECSELLRKKIRAELTIPEQAQVVGHVARFHPMKDHSLFLRAAVEIARRNENAHFVLSGRNVTLENRELGSLIPDSCYNRFHLLGERADIPALMAAMDILSSSSYGEGFPNVIGEAMATSLPCVVTDVGDSGFIVGEHGVVVPPKDQVALVTGIEKLLSLPEDELQALGAQGRKRIEDNFSLTAIVHQYAELYEKICLERKRII